MPTPQAQGINAQLLWVRETVWGTTPNTPSMVVIPFETESLSHAQARIQRSNLSTTRNPRKPTTGRAGASGDINVLLSCFAHGFLLADQLGVPTTTETHAAVVWAEEHAVTTDDYVFPVTKNGYVYKCSTAGTTGVSEPTWPTTLDATVNDGTAVWTCHAQQTFLHTFKIGTAPVGATIEKGFTDVPSYHPFTGGRGAGFSLKITDAGPVEAGFKYNFKGEGTVSGTSLDASPDSYPDVPWDCGNANVTITEGGSPIATVTALDLAVEIEQGTDAYVVGGQGQRAALPVGAVKVTGKISALFATNALYAKAKAGTESALVVVLAHGTGAGTTGNEKLTLTLPELVYDTNTPTVGGPAGVLWEGSFTAYYDNNASATALMLELLNSHVAYG